MVQPKTMIIAYAKLLAGASALALIAGTYYGAYHHGRTVERGIQAEAELATTRAQLAADAQLAAAREALALATQEAARKQAVRDVAAAKRSTEARLKGQTYVAQNPRPAVCEPTPDHRRLLNDAVKAGNGGA